MKRPIECRSRRPILSALASGRSLPCCEEAGAWHDGATEHLDSCNPSPKPGRTNGHPGSSYNIRQRTRDQRRPVSGIAAPKESRYSPCAVVNDLIFIAGQLARNENGQITRRPGFPPASSGKGRAFGLKPLILFSGVCVPFFRFVSGLGHCHARRVNQARTCVQA